MRRTSFARPLLLLALSACGTSSGGGTTADAASPAAPIAADPPSAAVAGALKISGFAYSPATLTVTPGQVVTVTNGDSAEHTVSSATAGLFDVNVTRGKPVTFTAPTEPGTYAFTCGFHPRMHGSLVVKG